MEYQVAIVFVIVYNMHERAFKRRANNIKIRMHDIHN